CGVVPAPALGVDGLAFLHVCPDANRLSAAAQSQGKPSESCWIRRARPIVAESQSLVRCGCGSPARLEAIASLSFHPSSSTKSWFLASASSLSVSLVCTSQPRPCIGRQPAPLSRLTFQ